MFVRSIVRVIARQKQCTSCKMYTVKNATVWCSCYTVLADVQLPQPLSKYGNSAIIMENDPIAQTTLVFGKNVLIITDTLLIPVFELPLNSVL